MDNPHDSMVGMVKVDPDLVANVLKAIEEGSGCTNGIGVALVATITAALAIDATGLAQKPEDLRKIMHSMVDSAMNTIDVIMGRRACGQLETTSLAGHHDLRTQVLRVPSGSAAPAKAADDADPMGGLFDEEDEH